MDRRNLAYDLSFYEAEQERHIARKEKKQSVIINAQTKFALGKRIFNVVSIAVLFALIIGVIATNASITAYSTKIADVDYYAEFDIPIPREDIKAIVICGTTYELNNTD